MPPGLWIALTCTYLPSPCVHPGRGKVPCIAQALETKMFWSRQCLCAEASGQSTTCVMSSALWWFLEHPLLRLSSSLLAPLAAPFTLWVSFTPLVKPRLQPSLHLQRCFSSPSWAFGPENALILSVCPSVSQTLSFGFGCASTSLGFSPGDLLVFPGKSVSTSHNSE